MKKTTLILSLLLPFTIALACDVCNTFDYSQDQNNTSVGLFRRYSFNNGYYKMPSLLNFSLTPPKQRHGGNTQNYFVNKTGTDYENSLTHELFINKNIKNKYLFQFRMPYVKNTTYISEITPRDIGAVGDTLVQTQGLGDLTIALFKIKLVQKEHITHRLNYGIGIQLPTGRYNTYTTNEFIDVKHAPGTGAWSFSPRIQYYNIINKRFGVTAQALYNRSTKRKTSINAKANSNQVGTLSGDYRFGDIFSIQGQAFYTIRYSLWNFIPKIGLLYTHETKDWFLNKEIDASGARLSELIVGADIRREKIGIRIQYLHPLYQIVHKDVVLKKGSYQIGIYYNFGKKSKKEDTELN